MVTTLLRISLVVVVLACATAALVAADDPKKLPATTLQAHQNEAAEVGEAQLRFEPLSNDESWKRMPPAESGGGQALPSWARALAGPMPRTTAALPPGFMKPSRIVWNQVCLGYQPELATAWETIMRTNAAESRGKVDRIFNVGLFWIVTRAIDCPLLHGPLLDELGGRRVDQVADRRAKSVARRQRMVELSSEGAAGLRG